MLLGVIVFNTLIATACFWGAWRLFCLRDVVQQWSVALDRLEADLQQTLPPVPLAIRHNRQQLRDRHQQYSQLQLRLGQYLIWTRQVLAFIQWGTVRWRGSGNLSRRASE